MKPKIQAVKGTRDYYPEVMAVRNFLYQTARRVSTSFGFQEWEGPLIETLELYAAKSGEELVKEQSFVFPDRGGDLITLRPELTPTLARMVAQRQKELVFPLRWWSWGPFWRYERPQKGRTREFFQWNVDLIGVNTPQADAEIVTVAASFLQEAGLTSDQVTILVNNRQLMNAELQALGIALDKRLEVFRLIDKRDKVTASEWNAYAMEIGLSKTQIEGLVAILSDQELWRKSDEMMTFFQTLRSLGKSNYVRFAPYIIRGLDYYTGTVFEAWDRDGEFRAILGGGRYDNLVSDVGGEPLPATGFAMGDVVIGLVLRKFNCLPQTINSPPASVLVTVFDQASIEASFSLATQLREEGLNVVCYPEAVKLSKQFKYADRMGIQLALVLGPEEQASNQVTIKDLRSGEQYCILQAMAEQKIRTLLSI